MVCPKCQKRIPRKSSYCLYCGTPLNLEIVPISRACILCGRILSEDSISDICENCLSGADTTPEELILPDDFPTPILAREALPTRKHLKWILLLLLGVAFLVSASFFLIPRFIEGMHLSASDHQFSETEKLAISIAQDMVRAKAYAPDTVHFDRQTLRVTSKDNLFEVTQQFERQTASGETATSEYHAQILNPGKNGGTPLRLEVDGALLLGS